MSKALAAAGWTAAPAFGRGDDVTDAASGVDLVLITTPDAVIAEVARAVRPGGDAVIAHCSGSLTLDALAPHARRASIHPLRPVPSGETVLAGASFATAGDPIAARVVADIGGHDLHVADADRVCYHAAACIASNHLVALLGQVERVAATAGVPLDAYFDLVRQTVDNVERLGPRAALTGPAQRGDLVTLDRHRDAIGTDEVAGYDAMVDLCRRLVA
jgi:predicted short-subunit dehydrogenase-like oxidoreductase (DUF2520 family)